MASTSTKGSTPAFFFGVDFYGLSPPLFFDPWGVSMGAFSEFKVPKSGDHLVKPGNFGPLSREAGSHFIPVVIIQGRPLVCVGPWEWN